MDLTKKQYKELVEALIDAFPTKEALEKMLIFNFGVQLNSLVKESNLESEVFELIKKFQTRGELLDFVRVARRRNPESLRLKRFLESLVLLVEVSKKTPVKEKKVKILFENADFCDVKSINSYQIRHPVKSAKLKNTSINFLHPSKLTFCTSIRLLSILMLSTSILIFSLFLAKGTILLSFPLAAIFIGGLIGMHITRKQVRNNELVG